MLSWISKTRHLNFRLFLDRYALCLSKCVVNTVCKLWREIYFIYHFLHTIHPHTKPTTAVCQRGNRLRKFDLQNNFFFRKAWRLSGEVMILTKSQNNRNVTGKKVKVFTKLEFCCYSIKSLNYGNIHLKWNSRDLDLLAERIVRKLRTIKRHSEQWTNPKNYKWPRRFSQCPSSLCILVINKLLAIAIF